MKTTHKNAGFTLVELLLYVAIVGSLLIGITGFYATVIDTRVKTQTINEVNQQGTFMMDYILQTVRNASSITTPAVGATSTNLVLAVPTGSLSPTTFSLNSSVLQVAEGSNAAVALSNSEVRVSNLSLKNLSRGSTNGIVQVSFIVTRINPTGNNRYDFERTFVGSAEVAW